MRIALVAGEASGDLLAGELIKAIKSRHPDAEFSGIAGPAMVEAGCEVVHDAEQLAVMGLVEVLRHYRRLSALRESYLRQLLARKPDVFIGVDAPDFNLYLERKLKAQGIKTVHYVSPSVWAWRQRRIKKIARSIDLMLTLFPFEAEFYQRHRVDVAFVGHPLADMIPLHTDQGEARRLLGLDPTGRWLALLPGSRMSEVKRIAEPMLRTAAWVQARCPHVKFIAPLATAATLEAFREMLQCQQRLTPALEVTTRLGDSRRVMAAADVVLLASGTATLEAALLKRPMVVTHRLAPMTYQLAKRMVKVPYVSLPNLLAGRALVAEYLQHDARPERLGPAVLALLESDEAIAPLMDEYRRIHTQLRRNASERAADAVLSLIDQR